MTEVFDAPVNSPQGDEAELLTILIDNYEEEHYPIEAPDPIEAIRFRMEQMNMNNKDLAEVIGYKSSLMASLVLAIFGTCGRPAGGADAGGA